MIAKYSFDNYTFVLSPTNNPLDDVVTIYNLKILDDIKNHSPDIFVKFRDTIIAVAYMHNSASHIPNAKIDDLRKQIWMRMRFCQADININNTTLKKLYTNNAYYVYCQSVYGMDFAIGIINNNKILTRYYFDLDIALSFINDLIDHVTEKRDIDNMLMEATSAKT